VEDAVDPVERLVDCVPVAQVPHHELRLGAQVGRRAVGVGERVEVVEHPHLVAGLQQRVHEVGADEARAAGDEDAAHQTV
jgi:hypothetical protein